MNLSINQYTQNQLSSSYALLHSHVQDEYGNEHIHRQAFYTIKKLIDDFKQGNNDPRLVVLAGLRGVGKTTLLAQLYMDLYKDQPKKLFYCSVDQVVNILDSDLNTVLEELQRIFGFSFERLNHRLYLFLDEIHFDSKWAAVLKMLYDKSKNIFVVCTGSSALSLQSNADLARRVIFEKLYPLNFTEYLLLNSKNLANSNSNIQIQYPVAGLADKIKDSIFYSQTAKECFAKLQVLNQAVKQYWMTVDKLAIDNFLKFGSLPFTLYLQDEARSQILVNQLIDRVVDIDLAKDGNFNQTTLSTIKNILLMTASSEQVNLSSLNRSLSNLSMSTLIDIFVALQKAELLIRVYPYGSVYKKVRKSSKYYFMSPAIRHALLLIMEGANAYFRHKGKYLEDVIAVTLYKEFTQQLSSPVFYDSAKGGADFIINLASKRIAIEVGFGNKKITQVRQTLAKIKGQYGIIISSSQLALEENIVKLPLEFFLLI